MLQNLESPPPPPLSGPAGRYRDQERGSSEAYQRYMAAMDGSMREKIARTTVHLPSSGVIADLGSGSGSGSYALAAMYPELQVIGIDINPKMVAYASETYGLPNLHFVQGDIRSPDFAPDAFSGVFACSVLHHVTSFNDFSLEVLGETLDGIVASLAPGGKLVIRDFVIPENLRDVYLDLPDSDGKDDGPVPGLSSAALFERFARDFRSSMHPNSGVAYEKAGSPEPGWTRYRVGLRDANEFILRKDYRQSWDVELREEYTYYSQVDFEKALRTRGMRVSYAESILNPWIEEHRYHGKVRLSNLDGTPIEFPATTAVVAASKVKEDQGVGFRAEGSSEIHEPRFIELRCYQHQDTGRVFELVTRPHPTVDIIPWYEDRGDLWILAKLDYPRPIITVNTPPLDGASLAGYLAEPINASLADLANSELAHVLERRAGLPAAMLDDWEPGLQYYPSPGASDQRTQSVFVRTERPDRELAAEAYSGFSSSGSIKALEVQQLLRAAAVGALFDSRLEMNAYRLLLTHGRPAGPWIGAELHLGNQKADVVVDREAQCLFAPKRNRFTMVSASEGKGFYTIHSTTFVEVGLHDDVVARNTLEYARPAHYSDNTVAYLPLARCDGEVLVGLEERDLPAGIAHGEGSRLMTLPAFRIPKSITGVSEAKAWVEGRLLKEFGIRVKQASSLGGRYYPAAGLLPEVVYPFAAEIDLQGAVPSRDKLVWVPLEKLLQHHECIHDTHLLTAVFRAAHACSLLDTRAGARAHAASEG